MKYVSNRNITIASTCGLSREFKKGEPLECPPQMHAELLAAGIIPVDPLPEEVVTLAPGEPDNHLAREKALFECFEKLLLRNKRGDFTPGGVPHAAVLSRELGWTVEPKERDGAWAKFSVEKADA